MERATAFQAARRGQLPRQLLDSFPSQAAVVQQLLQHSPAARPTAQQLLAQPFVLQTLEAAAAAAAARLAERGAAGGPDLPQHPLLAAGQMPVGPGTPSRSSSGLSTACSCSAAGAGDACTQPRDRSGPSSQPSVSSAAAEGASKATRADPPTLEYQGRQHTAQQLLELLQHRDAEVAALAARVAQLEGQAAAQPGGRSDADAGA
jgi:hypothetical protein